MLVLVLGGYAMVLYLERETLSADNAWLRQQLTRQSLEFAQAIRQQAGLLRLLDRLTDRGSGWEEREW